MRYEIQGIDGFYKPYRNVLNKVMAETTVCIIYTLITMYLVNSMQVLHMLLLECLPQKKLSVSERYITYAEVLFLHVFVMTHVEGACT